MIRINLLPYRAFRRKAKLVRDGIGGLVFLILLIGGGGFGYWYLQAVEERHRARVAYMEEAMDEMQAKLGEVNDIKERRKQLTQKLEVIQGLQRGRDLPVKILRTLGRAVPEAISLRSMEQTANGLAVEGVAQSNNVVSSFMRRLEATTLFTSPDLKVISGTRDDGQARKEFSMQVAIVPPAKRSEEQR